MTGEIILFGAGGHAKVVLESLLFASPSANVVIVDDAAKPVKALLGHPVLAGRREIERLGKQARVIPAIGNNVARAAVTEWLIDLGAEPISVIDRRAAVSRSASIGRGAFVAPGVVINAQSQIEDAVIVNTGASIDHDCAIGIAAHIAPGVRLCGGVSVGPRALVGVGTSIIPGIRVGADAVIGAGSVVIRDVADGARVAGNPARSL